MSDKQLAIECFKLDLTVLEAKRDIQRSINESLSSRLNKEKNYQLRKYIAELLYNNAIELSKLSDTISNIIKTMEVLTNE